MNHTDYLQTFPKTDPWSLLSADRARMAISIRDYMLGSGRMNGDPDTTLTKLSHRIVDAGVPLDRCVTIVRILHAINTASYRMWEKDNGTTSFAIPFASRADGQYENSPSALAHQFNQWVEFNPQTTPDDAFGIVDELKEAGFTHYICAPTLMVNRMQNVFTFSTRALGGFSLSDIAFLRVIFPALEACQEILVTHRILKEVTRTYVGNDPHERILAGDVHRGDVTSRPAAILFADMRDFTGLTAEMTAQQATDLLNEYYDCVVPAVEGNGGEVLKFIGDGVLAMFRLEKDETDACNRALVAAQAGLAAVITRADDTSTPFSVGMALHFGEVAYGNVGSGERLDYTVIGRDVNLASRVATLCSTLSEPLLLSDEFKLHLTGECIEEIGTHTLKGLTQPVAIYRPSRTS
jgi:adenylate cyclase